MKYEIEINDELFDHLLTRRLTEDLKSLNQDVHHLYIRDLTENLAPFQREDLSDTVRYRDAAIVMLSYYLPRHEFDELMQGISPFATEDESDEYTEEEFKL
jgi:hypothetical protein